VRKNRKVFVVNAATSAVTMVVLAVVALVVTPPSPPSVAEFSPQSREQIFVDVVVHGSPS
jgi:hypothetical protein